MAVAVSKAREVRARKEALNRKGLTIPMEKIIWLSICVGGIWVSYLTQGVLQENLSTKKFGPDQERFVHLTFLNLAQNVVCLVWSFLMLVLFTGGGRAQPPITAYWSASITNSIGPALGIEALKYISYPAQVLAKSSKMIPVMVMGAIMYRVSYKPSEYICSALVAGGVSVFALFKGSAKAASKLASPNAPLGYLLCFGNLALDGFTNATQDQVKKRHPKVSVHHMMLGMNLFGTLYTAAYMFLVPQGGGFEAVQFCLKHREAAMDILVYCLCGAVGQNFIFLTINKFGALANTTITTTRKFMSILISALWNGNPLTKEQWVGVTMVFAGLLYQIILKWQKEKAKRAAAQAAASDMADPKKLS